MSWRRKGSVLGNRRLTYGSWSIAQGIKQGISVLSPKIWGNEFENDGVAWIEAKWNIPTFSLKKHHQ